MAIKARPNDISFDVSSYRFSVQEIQLVVKTAFARREWISIISVYIIHDVSTLFHVHNNIRGNRHWLGILCNSTTLHVLYADQTRNVAKSITIILCFDQDNYLCITRCIRVNYHLPHVANTLSWFHWIGVFDLQITKCR